MTAAIKVPGAAAIKVPGAEFLLPFGTSSSSEITDHVTVYNHLIPAT